MQDRQEAGQKSRIQSLIQKPRNDYTYSSNEEQGKVNINKTVHTVKQRDNMSGKTKKQKHELDKEQRIEVNSG